MLRHFPVIKQHRERFLVVAAAVLFLSAFMCGHAAQAKEGSLRFPIDIKKQQELFPTDKAASSCEVPNFIPHRLARVGYYTNPPHYSKIDPKKYAQEQALEAPIRKEEQFLTEAVSRLIQSSPREAGLVSDCIVQHLLIFAQEDAFTGSNDIGGTGMVQLFSLTPLFAYAAVRSLDAVPETDARQIEPWIRRLATKLIEWQKPFPRQNNIRYWAGAALAFAAIGLDDRSFLEAALEIARKAAAEVDKQGLLPQEMERADRALEYNLYATQALSIIGVAASANGVDVFRAYSDGALLRLMARMLQSIRDPSSFVQISGHPASVAPDKISRQNLGWLEVYRAVSGDASVDDLICRYKPLISYGVGGDWYRLMGSPAQCAH